MCKIEINKFISQVSPKSFNVWTVPEKMNEIFLSVTAEGVVWVLLETDLCQKLTSLWDVFIGIEN